MAIREIVKIPDAILREVSNPLERVDDEVRALLDDMADTMYDAPGIGLAGVQIGVPLRLVVVDCTKRSGDEEEEGQDADTASDETDEEPAEEERNPIFLINPEIVSLSDEPSVYEEGCLSIPDFYADVERPAACAVRYVDYDGKEQVLEAEGLLSTCLQHEIDHLNGRLFIDHLSKLKRDMVIRKFTKIAKQSGTLPSRRMVG